MAAGAKSDVPRNASREPTAQMYRDAAEETLEQLDWCVEYLYRIRKPRIARAIAKNRAEIRRQMRR
jgi:hypothetical protein